MKLAKGPNLPPLIFGVVLLIIGLVFFRLQPPIPSIVFNSPITDLQIGFVRDMLSYIQSLSISIPLILAGLISIALGLTFRKPTGEK
jgi:formate hydrogenlyase subunit 3/multisubunit Na+/H+ antiporter MnhD subunit